MSTMLLPFMPLPPFEFFFTDRVLCSPTLKVLIQESKGRVPQISNSNLEVKEEITFKEAGVRLSVIDRLY
jgi:hypothetical protein